MLLTSAQYITFKVGAVRDRARTIRGRGGDIKTSLFIELAHAQKFESQSRALPRQAAGLMMPSFRQIVVSHCELVLKIKVWNTLITKTNNNILIIEKKQTKKKRSQNVKL